MLNMICCFVKKSIKTTLCCMAVCSCISAQNLLISRPETVYTGDTLDARAKSRPGYHSVGNAFVVDASFLAVMEANGKVKCLLTTPLYGHDIYRGFLTDNTFLDEHVESIPYRKCWKNADDFHKNFSGYTIRKNGEVGYLANIYIHSDTLWIGFVHIERTDKTFWSDAGTGIKRNYAVGIAASNDKGRMWRYYGDIIRPNYDPMPPVSNNSNICGVPYIVVNDNGKSYFYVYFNEHKRSEFSDSSGTHHFNETYPAVARKEVDSVVALISATTAAAPWKKYDTAKNWNADGFTGLGSNITFNEMYASSPTHYFNFTLHSDAVEIRDKKIFALVVNYSKALFGTDKAVEIGNKLLTSEDGITWKSAGVIECGAAGKNMHMFESASIFSIDKGDRADGSVVKNRFAVVYAKLPLDNKQEPDIRNVEIRKTVVKF